MDYPVPPESFQHVSLSPMLRFLSRRRGVLLLLAGFGWLALGGEAQAGMPSIKLSDVARMRVQAISFFGAGLLLSALGVQFLWNMLQRDFQRMPRLTYGKAVACVVLWGLLFLIVLTMISGARELMTPGAWKKNGFTYELAENASEGDAQEDQRAERRQKLERLWLELERYSAKHDGRFPASAEDPEIADELWELPRQPGLRYFYRPRAAGAAGNTILAYEPQLETGRQFVLWNDGGIDLLESSTLRRILESGEYQ